MTTNESKLPYRDANEARDLALVLTTDDPLDDYPGVQKLWLALMKKYPGKNALVMAAEFLAAFAEDLEDRCDCGPDGPCCEHACHEVPCEKRGRWCDDHRTLQSEDDHIWWREALESLASSYEAQAEHTTDGSVEQHYSTMAFGVRKAFEKLNLVEQRKPTVQAQSEDAEPDFREGLGECFHTHYAGSAPCRCERIEADRREWYRRGKASVQAQPEDDTTTDDPNEVGPVEWLRGVARVIRQGGAFRTNDSVRVDAIASTLESLWRETQQASGDISAGDGAILYYYDHAGDEYIACARGSDLRKPIAQKSDDKCEAAGRALFELFWERDRDSVPLCWEQQPAEIRADWCAKAEEAING